jgi:hypothetical protein
MSRFILPLIFLIVGAVLYVAVATITDRKEGWILWSGVGLLLVSTGLVRLLFHLVSPVVGLKRRHVKNALVSSESVAIVATFYWLLSRIAPTYEDYCYFSGWATFLCFISPVVLLIVFWHQRPIQV